MQYGVHVDEMISSSSDGNDLHRVDNVSARLQWTIAIVLLVVTGLLCAIPFVANAIVPEQDERRVGVLEQVRITENDEQGSVTAGFMAPEGWLSAGDAQSSGGPEFETGAGTEYTFVAIRLKLEPEDAALRSGLPIGATLTPVEEVTFPNGETYKSIEYDLAAGSQVNQRVVNCADGERDACLVFDIVSDASIESTDEITDAVVALIESSEIMS